MQGFELRDRSDRKQTGRLDIIEFISYMRKASITAARALSIVFLAAAA